MPDTGQPPIPLNTGPEPQENLESDPSDPSKTPKTWSAPSVGAVLDELEDDCTDLDGFDIMVPQRTALALIEVARRVEALAHKVERYPGCEPSETHFISLNELPDAGLPDYIEVLPDACPVCALGRLAEGRAD